MRELMRNSRNHVSCALEVMYAFKKLKNLQSENLNDANIIFMPMSATCKVKMERIILFMRNRILAASSQRSSVRISHGSENFDFRC